VGRCYPHLGEGQDCWLTEVGLAGQIHWVCDLVGMGRDLASPSEYERVSSKAEVEVLLPPLL
jgi:hypothetical protein